MILKELNDRVVLWGAAIHENCVTAELCYFGTSITAPKIVLESKVGRKRVTILMPEVYKSLDVPARAQMLMLSR